MNIDRAPKGVRRAIYRLPIFLYKARLGRLLGGRVLMLTHTGRKSGLLRYVVLEVIKREPQHWYVPAAYGEHADWFRNIRANPEVTVDYRGHRTRALAQTLSVAEGADVLADYALRHPRAARALGKLMDLPLEGDMLEAARVIPIVRISAR